MGASAAAAVSRRALLLGGVFAGALLAAGCAPRAERRTPDAASLRALVYAGPQGCPGCAPAIGEALGDAPRPFQVEYVGPGTGRPLTAEALARADLYVQPGGGDDLAATWRDLEGSADAVRDWVAGGGRYLGICFGGYLAGRAPGFDLLPGDAFGWAGSPGASVPDARDTVIPVRWRGERRHVYFQDGPGFALEDGAEAEVLATYDDGVPAVLVAAHGAGRVAVTGPHLEADASWYAEKGLRNPDGVDPELLHRLLGAVMT